MNEIGARRLAAGVIEKAVNDYRLMSKRRSSKSKKRFQSENKDLETREELRSFFFGKRFEFFATILDLDSSGAQIIEELDDQVLLGTSN